MNFPSVKLTRLPRINCNKEFSKNKIDNLVQNVGLNSTNLIFELNLTNFSDSGSDLIVIMVLSSPKNFDLRLKLRKQIRKVSEKNSKGKTCLLEKVTFEIILLI